jgi:hypothetical protein
MVYLSGDKVGNEAAPMIKTADEPFRGRTVTSILFLSALKWARS